MAAQASRMVVDRRQRGCRGGRPGRGGPPAAADRGPDPPDLAPAQRPPRSGRSCFETLPLQDAARLLLDRTEENRPLKDDDAAQATSLARVLGGLPLALEQAAAYINRHRLSLARYWEAWQQEREKVLSWYAPRVMQYPESVAVTWQRSFERLGSGAAALLRLASFLAPDPIPVALFADGEELWARAVREPGREGEGLGVLEALAEARGALPGQAPSRVVLRASHGPGSGAGAGSGRRTGRVAGRDPESPGPVCARAPGRRRTWPVWDALRPHLAQLLPRADREGIAEPTARLMNQLWRLLYSKGLYAASEPWIRRALAIDETVLGPDHPDVADRLSNLGQLLQETHRLGEAEPSVCRALAIQEAAWGPEHPNVASVLKDLGALLRRTNRLRQAVPLFAAPWRSTKPPSGRIIPSWPPASTNWAGC